MSPRYRVGQLCLFETDGSWWLVEKTGLHGPAGRCFVQPKNRQYPDMPGGWWIGDCRPIPDDKVPDEIWAALAKWRLLDA